MESYPAQPQFRPVRKESCFCGSGRAFGNCCGRFAETRTPPHGICVIPGYVNRTTCHRWVEYLESQPRNRLMVVDTERSTTENIVQVPDRHRITEEVQSGRLRSKLGALARRAYTTVIARTCKRRFAWLEEPVVLRYQSGGQYGIHADSDYFDPRKKVWFKCMDRDMSMLIYLNEEFSGGDIRFVNFNFTHRPKLGDLVFFPSDHRYMHEAQLVTSGIRYSVVSWAAFKNRKRIMNEPQGSRIMLT
jgi:predicted 2-oxoglutarate/Fe(II)-dependent dioxygenase YbiX